MDKTQYISMLILQEQAKGKSIREALDTVCGAGTFQRLAGEVYDALRAGVRQ